MGFLWLVFSFIRTKLKILFLYGKIRVSKSQRSINFNYTSNVWGTKNYILCLRSTTNLFHNQTELISSIYIILKAEWITKERLGDNTMWLVNQNSINRNVAIGVRQSSSWVSERNDLWKLLLYLVWCFRGTHIPCKHLMLSILYKSSSFLCSSFFFLFLF